MDNFRHAVSKRFASPVLDHSGGSKGGEEESKRERDEYRDIVT
jgi:hypothetical protein